jgi:hypothetical protein
MKLTLPTGRIVNKSGKTHCVATQCNGRWSTKYYKTMKGAQNDITYLRKCSDTTRAYYGIEVYHLILGEYGIFKGRSFAPILYTQTPQSHGKSHSKFGR